MGRHPTTLPSLFLPALVLFRPGGSVYTFRKQDVPVPFGLAGRYKFYLSPPGARVNDNRIAEVQLSGVRLAPVREVTLPSEVFLEVGIVPLAYFDQLVNGSDFCSFADSASKRPKLVLRNHEAKENSQVSLVTADAVSTKHDLRGSGIFMLIIANCGNSTDVELHGSIMIRSPHGFLDGLEYFKKPLYASLLWAYFIISAVYLIVSAIKRELFSTVRIGVLMVAILGTVEVGAYYYHLEGFDETAEEATALQVSQVFGLMKLIHAVAIALYLADGEHLKSKEGDRPCLTWPMVALVVFGCVPKSYIFTSRHHIVISSEILATNAGLVILSTSLIVRGLVLSLRSTMQCLQKDPKDPKAEVQLCAFRRYYALTLFGFVIAVFVVIGALLLDTPTDESTSWLVHVFWSDGLGQGSFALCLVLAMLAIRPAEESSTLGLSLPHGEQGSSGQCSVRQDSAGKTLEEKASGEGRAIRRPVPETIGIVGRVE